MKCTTCGTTTDKLYGKDLFGDNMMCAECYRDEQAYRLQHPDEFPSTPKPLVVRMNKAI